jgi:heme-degrading monooxygenase HmoA
VIWLKQPGDETARRHYIEQSRRFADLPGVLAYDVGTPSNVIRRHTSSALDESYDVAIASVFESQQAFEAFLKNPEYGRVAREVLKPLVDNYRVYDFIE